MSDFNPPNGATCINAFDTYNPIFPDEPKDTHQIKIDRSDGSIKCSKCGTDIPKGFPYSEVSSNHGYKISTCHLCLKDVANCVDVLIADIPEQNKEKFISDRFVSML